MFRRLVLALLAPSGALVLAACDGNEAGRESTAPATELTTTTTTTPGWVGLDEEEEWWAVDDVCLTATDEAVVYARELLTLDTTPSADALAEYYRRRATHLEGVVRQLAELTPPESVADEWPAALDGLAEHTEWLRDIADIVEVEGLDADQTPQPGLEDFRQLMIYGACHTLLDVN